MTTIQDIPEEVLLVIFDNLFGRDLINCQLVCQSRYTPARVRFLNQKVVLRNTSRIKRFITAINKNPRPRLLAAVKHIEIWNTKNWNVTDAILQKLLFRFPNLESVGINETLLNKFDDDLCRTFLKHCPKLADLTVGAALYLEDHRKLINARLLLVELDFEHDIINEGFVMNFPRLKSLTTSKHLKTFESLLPVLAHLSDLKKLKFRKFENGSHQFLERYLQIKSPEEKQQLLERISKITDLEIESRIFLSDSAVKFIMNYMTGLEAIEIRTALANNPEQIKLCCDMFSMAQTLYRCFFVVEMPIDVLRNSLPMIMHQVYQPPVKEKALSIYVGNEIGSAVIINKNDALYIKKSDIIYMRINMSDSHLHNRSNFFDDVLELDKFTLEMSYNNNNNTRAFNAFFGTKSTFKQVKFYLRETTVGGNISVDEEVGENHTFVEKLTIIAGPKAEIDPLLDRCSAAFPNLRFLALYDFCGNLQNVVLNYQLKLTKYTLENLTVNVTHLITSDKQQRFMWIRVQVLSLGGKYLYKIPLTLSERVPDKLDDKDLEGLECGKDYTLLHLTVGSLRHLKLVLNRSTSYGTGMNTDLDTLLLSVKFPVINE